MPLVIRDVRGMHACTRGQLTWLDCFEQKYLSIYIYLSQENLFENGCIYIYIYIYIQIKKEIVTSYSSFTLKAIIRLSQSTKRCQL